MLTVLASTEVKNVVSVPADRLKLCSDDPDKECPMSNYEWSEWGDCTQSCSDQAEPVCGHKTRLGVCPVNKSCEGESEQTMECNCQKCPVSSF